MSIDLNIDYLLQRFSAGIIGTAIFRQETTLVVDRSIIREFCKFLRDDEAFAFDMLSDLCGVDMLPATPRFQVVYHLYSLRHGFRLRLKVPLADEDANIDSVVTIWETAEWHERECFDLLGIRFHGHSDLRRILLPENFEGHPLRKDFPLEGVQKP